MSNEHKIVIAIFHKGYDLIMEEFFVSMDTIDSEIMDLLEFHFSEKQEPLKEHAILFKENYFNEYIEEAELMDWFHAKNK